jgi:hypothetical protein
MSSTFQQHFTPDDLNMIRRVLDNAGLHDRPGEATHHARLSASLFLITCFQQGISTELALREELHHHLYQDTSEPVRAGEPADVQGWENEGGAVAAEPQTMPLLNLRLVAGQTPDVRRIMLGFPDFMLSYVSAGPEGDVPRMLPMAA